MVSGMPGNVTIALPGVLLLGLHRQRPGHRRRRGTGHRRGESFGAEHGHRTRRGRPG